MKIVKRKQKEEADLRFGNLLRKQVNDHTQKMTDTADADTLFAKLEDATVSWSCLQMFLLCFDVLEAEYYICGLLADTDKQPNTISCCGDNSNCFISFIDLSIL